MGTAGAARAEKPRADAKPNGPGVVHAVLINGGGSASDNFRSHLRHLEGALALIRRAGIPDQRITVFASDGSDDAPDLAVLDQEPEEGLWLLEGLPLSNLLAPRLSYVNSQLAGVTLQPATRDAIARWFRTLDRRMSPRDTLLLFVTDHGTNGTEDPFRSRITLWGKNQSLSVQDLSRHLARAPRGSRVVSLMSQCFSGGFAHIHRLSPREGGLDGVTACGYFSSTPFRPAYGCYPESRGQDDIGQAFRFFQSLEKHGRFATAHRDTLVTDDTPDVPLRSSDVFIDDLLARAAEAAGETYEVLVDRLLAEAFRNRAAWESELRLLDAIGRTFGLFSPRSLAELEDPEKNLDKLLEQLETHGERWQLAAADMCHANLDHFMKQSPDWRARLAPQQVQSLPPTARRALAHEFLSTLLPFSQKARDRFDRIQLVTSKLDSVSEVAYRMEVRYAALLRMRILLSRVAGEHFLATSAERKSKEAFAALTSCEAFELPGAARPTLQAQAGQSPNPQTEALPEVATPYPRFEEDLALVDDVFPSWLGIHFDDVPAKLRASLRLGAGASLVRAVYDDSPAAQAGIQAGDIVLGPPGATFTERYQVRSWTMITPREAPAPLEVLREGKRLVMQVKLAPYPGEKPDLPTPLDVGEAAPPLTGARVVRGKPIDAVATSAAHVVYFWATWCDPCKAALPELLAYSAARNTPVIAVSDEDPATVQAFLARFGQPFPGNVIVDETRRSFIKYGVSGTPTFVVVGPDGIVRARQSGYHPSRGLAFDGWAWKR